MATIPGIGLCRGSLTETPFADGTVEIQVVPSLMADRSDEAEREFVFSYRIRITNRTSMLIQVLSRRWDIVDAVGRRRTVEGEGLVGRQPILGPGQLFQYESFCPLETKWGTMEGAFFARAKALSKASSASSVLDEPWSHRIELQIGRFFLVAGEASKAEGSTPGRVKSRE